jgi:uncharacterized membrane protein
MPGWIWIILVLFLVTMIAVGLWYAFCHFRQALASLTPLQHTIQKDMNEISAVRDRAQHGSSKPLVLTHSVGQTAADYEEAHYRLVVHRQKAHNRRDQRWARWARFNTDTELTEPNIADQKGYTNGSKKSSLS